VCKLACSTLKARPAFGALPGSRRELMDAASALPGSTLLLDRSATEQRLKSEALDSYEFLHFAVHVAVDTERPDRTALVLADGPGSTEDGLLQAREIATSGWGHDSWSYPDATPASRF